MSTMGKRSRIAEGIAAAFTPGAARAAQIAEAEDRLVQLARTLGRDPEPLIEQARQRFVASAQSARQYDIIDALDEMYQELASGASR